MLESQYKIFMPLSNFDMRLDYFSKRDEAGELAAILSVKNLKICSQEGANTESSFNTAFSWAFSVPSRHGPFYTPLLWSTRLYVMPAFSMVSRKSDNTRSLSSPSTNLFSSMTYCIGKYATLALILISSSSAISSLRDPFGERRGGQNGTSIKLKS